MRPHLVHAQQLSQITSMWICLDSCPGYGGTMWVTGKGTSGVRYTAGNFGLGESQTDTIEAMSIQIAVRLPDAQVAFLDREVSQGHASSRAELVSKALNRMERERIAARDLEIIIASGGNPYSELEGMLEQLVATYPALD